MIEVHIRHGQSIRNAGMQQYYAGKGSVAPEVLAMNEADWYLTEQGKKEAIAAGEYLRKHFPRTFEVAYHSPYLRTKETAELLGLADLVWQVDPRLREQSWGPRHNEPLPQDPKVLLDLKVDPAYRSVDWRAHPQGDSWEDVLKRSSALYAEVDAEHAGKDRIFVSHGGVLRMTRMFREGITPERFPELFEEPYRYFTNCQLIIYTDEDPATGQVSPDRRWVKSVCPWNEDQWGHDWMEVK